MPYPNEHAARVRDPDAFQPNSMRSKSIEKGVRIIIGRLTGETTTTTQAYRFDKNEYTAAEAKKWLKDHNIVYLSFEAAIENLIELHSAMDNSISNTHDVILQRLDTLIKNNGRMILYPADAFQNTSEWVGAPVVYAETNGEPLKHPSAREVITGALPGNMREVGRVVSANISGGEPTLRGEIEIDDPEIDAMTSTGALSLSTGFSANVANVDGQDMIVGGVTPNHVLVFRRGACRNCYPNDNSARFENTQDEGEDNMDDESKGLLKSIKEALENLKPAPAAPKNVPEEPEVDKEDLKNITEERDALKAKLEEIENAAEQEKKDAAWSEMKNVLPVGWLGDKEAETRKEFEADNAKFAVKFAKFTAENSAPEKDAEGSSTASGDADTAEIEMKNMVEDMGKRTGFILVGGEE